MSLPANILVVVGAPFPARVQGAGFIALSKANGIWTIRPDYTVLAPLLTLAELPSSLIAIYDPATGQFNSITAAQLGGSGSSIYRMVTAAGDVAITGNDFVILMNKTVPAATNINLPASIGRNGVPVTVKDYGGIALANPITFVVAAGETIDGFTQTQANTNGVSKISTNYGKKTLFPLTSGGWYL